MARNPVISFSLSPDTTARLALLAPRFGNNRSSVVNEAIRRLAEELGVVPPVNPFQDVTMHHISLVCGGQPLPIIAHQGKHYAVAPASGTFAIRLHNPSFGRREFVVSVDGIDILDGEAASQTKRGYVIGAMGSSDILGWRRGTDTVAAFEFVGEGQSYAEKTGRGTNRGVIAVAVYNERVHRENVTRGMQVNCGIGEFSLGPTYSTNAGKTKTKGGLDLGTGYGKEVSMGTSVTTFTRAAGAPTTFVLHYATAEALRAMGVPVDVATSPNPWPGDGPRVPAPAGWTP